MNLDLYNGQHSESYKITYVLEMGEFHIFLIQIMYYIRRTLFLASSINIYIIMLPHYQKFVSITSIGGYDLSKGISIDILVNEEINIMPLME